MRKKNRRLSKNRPDAYTRVDQHVRPYTKNLELE